MSINPYWVMKAHDYIEQNHGKLRNQGVWDRLYFKVFGFLKPIETAGVLQFHLEKQMERDRKERIA